MAFCTNCGKELNDGAQFCPACGTKKTTETNSSTANSNSSSVNDTINNIGDKFNDFTNTADSTSSFEQSDISDNKIFAILSYFGILFVIGLFAAPNSKFAKFHANQGLVLLISSVILYIVAGILTAILVAITRPIFFIFNPFSGLFFTIASLGVLAFTILGIINAATGKAKELPLIGKIKIIK